MKVIGKMVRLSLADGHFTNAQTCLLWHDEVIIREVGFAVRFPETFRGEELQTRSN